MKYRLLVILLASMFSNMLYAQENVAGLSFKAGNNAVAGYFSAISLDVNSAPCKNFSLTGGLQYNFSSGFVAEARPAFYYDFPKMRLSVEALLHYLPQSNIHNVSVGGGFGIRARYFWAKLGYYHRSMVSDGSSLYEPFNVYYEFGVNILPSVAMCDLMVSITNNRIFDLERHYQPSFVLDCMFYPFDKWGIVLGCSYKPAGMFNISSDYFQFYANLGVCYKW